MPIAARSDPRRTAPGARKRAPVASSDTSPPSTSDKSQIQVIARASSILRALENDAAGLSLAQIALRTQLPRSTVQRIVAALQSEKLVGTAQDGRAVLGPSILRLAGSAQADLISLARPLLAALSSELRETVDLAIVRRDHLVFVDQVVGPHRLRTVSAVGGSFPLTCTANGKAYLAMLDDEAIAALVGKSYPKRTPHTILKLDALLREIRKIRKQGIAFDREEHTHGICAAGVATSDWRGNAIVLSTPTPSHRFAAMEGLIARRLLETRDALARMLGGE